MPNVIIDVPDRLLAEAIELAALRRISLQQVLVEALYDCVDLHLQEGWRLERVARRCEPTATQTH